MMVILTEDPVEDGGGSRSHLSAGKQRRGVVPTPGAGPPGAGPRAGTPGVLN
jgi:hypothetical protein